MIVEAPNTSILDSGDVNPYNPEKQLHERAVKIQITNPSAVPLDAILFASDNPAYAPAGGTLAGRLLTDGTASYTNIAGQAVADVVTSVDYGITNVASMAAFQRLIKEKGLTVAGGRLRMTTTNQLINKLKYTEWRPFGNNHVWQLDPEAYWNNQQYQANVVDWVNQMVFSQDTMMEYRVNAGETVTISLYVTEVLETKHFLAANAIQKGGTFFQ